MNARVACACLSLCFAAQPPGQMPQNGAGVQPGASRQVPVSPQPPVFRAEAKAVSVNVLVTRGGHPLAGLGAGDFELLDNGIQQRPQLALGQGAVSAALLIDRSLSVANGPFRDLVAAGGVFTRGLKPPDRAWLLTFSHRLALAPVRDPAAMLAALGEIRPGGNTSMYDAIVAGVSLVVSDAGRALVVVCTDGMDTASWLKWNQVRDIVRRSNVVLYSLGAPGNGTIGRGGELASLADETGGSILDLGDSSLSQRLNEIVTGFRARYVLTYEPTGVRHDDGWHRITVRLKGKTGKVQARRGYYASSGRGS